MSAPLANAARIVAELRDRLKSDYALDDGDDALETTLEGASDLPEMLANMARQAVEAETHSEAIGQLIKAHAARAARLESKAQNLRVQIAWALQEAGWKRIPAGALPEMTVTMRDGNAPMIVDRDDAIPDEFCRIKTVRIPDKPFIRRVLENGRLLDFARLGNPQPTLTIRKG